MTVDQQESRSYLVGGLLLASLACISASLAQWVGPPALIRGPFEVSMFAISGYLLGTSRQRILAGMWVSAALVLILSTMCSAFGTHVWEQSLAAQVQAQGMSIALSSPAQLAARGFGSGLWATLWAEAGICAGWGLRRRSMNRLPLA